MQINSDFSFNTVIWISSILPPEDQGPSSRMIDEMNSIKNRLDFNFETVKVSSVAELECIFVDIAHRAEKKELHPILNFDMHGNKELGLLIRDNEYFSWQSLVDHLRPINTATENNLCIVSVACFSYNVIKSIKTLNYPSPFFIMLAPENKVYNGFIEQKLPAFYENLFQFDNLSDAYKNHLFEQFHYFHCERILLLAIARYIIEGCKGQSKKKRQEKLLSELFLQGIEKTKKNLKTVRQGIKKGILPNQCLLDHYTKTFLINKPCGFKIDQLLAYINEYKS